MTVLEALKGVLKLALIHDGLARGLREASKALDRRQAHMCVLNEGCEEEAYKKLVVALCGEHQIPLIKVPDGKMLGEWAGLCECLPFPYSIYLLHSNMVERGRRCARTGERDQRSVPLAVFIQKALGSRTPLRYLPLLIVSFIANSLFPGVLDREGNARKVVNCSCVVVRDWGEESQERSILLNYFQTEQ